MTHLQMPVTASPKHKKQKARDWFMQNVLEGKYFHSLIQKDKAIRIQWQGLVLGSPEQGWYLVQLFSWLTGEPTAQCLVPFEQMRDWLFYSDTDAMSHSYEYGEAKQFRR